MVVADPGLFGISRPKDHDISYFRLVCESPQPTKATGACTAATVIAGSGQGPIQRCCTPTFGIPSRLGLCFAEIEADDLIFSDASGEVTGKADEIRTMKSGGVKFESIEMSDT